MTDHPQWVWERAAQELNSQLQGAVVWSMHDRGPIMTAVANLIAKYEQPPVDPDEEVVKAVIKAWAPRGVHWSLCPDDFARALAVYKAHKAIDTTPTA